MSFYRERPLTKAPKGDHKHPRPNHMGVSPPGEESITIQWINFYPVDKA